MHRVLKEKMFFFCISTNLFVGFNLIEYVSINDIKQNRTLYISINKHFFVSSLIYKFQTLIKITTTKRLIT